MHGSSRPHGTSEVRALPWGFPVSEGRAGGLLRPESPTHLLSKLEAQGLPDTPRSHSTRPQAEFALFHSSALPSRRSTPEPSGRQARFCSPASSRGGWRDD
jgi:hypothetical protein